MMLDFTTIAILIAIAAGLYFIVVPKAFDVKEGIENRRERSVMLAAWSKVNGLPLLTNLFSKYAIGDYTGVVAALDQLHDTLADNDLAQQAVNNFLKVQFNKALETAEGRETLLKLVEEKFRIEIPREDVTAFYEVREE